MSQTRLALIHWTYGQMKSETLGAQILRLENYQGIAPVHPTGGPDGGKDIIAQHPSDGRKTIGGCFFPNDSDDKSFAAIETKFKSDLDGAVGNSAKIFAFITNTSITDGEETTLRNLGIPKGCVVEIFDLERITLILDSPRGFGLRFQILGLKMSEAEQTSFFNNWENIILDEIKRVGMTIEKVSSGQDQMMQMLSTLIAQTAGTGQAQTGESGAIV